MRTLALSFCHTPFRDPAKNSVYADKEFRLAMTVMTGHDSAMTKSHGHDFLSWPKNPKNKFEKKKKVACLWAARHARSEFFFFAIFIPWHPLLETCIHVEKASRCHVKLCDKSCINDSVCIMTTTITCCSSIESHQYQLLIKLSWCSTCIEVIHFVPHVTPRNPERTGRIKDSFEGENERRERATCTNWQC